MTVSNQQYDLMYCPRGASFYRRGASFYRRGASIEGNQYRLVSSDLMLTLRNAFSIFVGNGDVMYLSDIKSCVARTSIGAQFLSVGAQFLSVGAQLLTIGAQDAPASCYELCVK